MPESASVPLMFPGRGRSADARPRLRSFPGITRMEESEQGDRAAAISAYFRNFDRKYPANWYGRGVVHCADNFWADEREWMPGADEKHVGRDFPHDPAEIGDVDRAVFRSTMPVVADTV